MSTEYKLSYTAAEIDEKLGKITDVDQVYDPESSNAQSGVAIAGINTKANDAYTTANDASNVANNAYTIAGEAKQHTIDFAADDDGVHGIRFTADHKVQIKDEHEVWTTVVNPYKTYTAIIDETQQDPDLAVSYADDAEEMEAKSEEWMETDIFKDIRPCVFRDGEVQCYLDPNDFTQQIKNTDPMFYAEDEVEVRINDKCSYAEIIEAENALLYDVDGNSLPTGRTNTNWDIGYGVQGGGYAYDQDRKENITVCYRGDGHMEYRFNVPLAGQYYWFIKFNSQISNAVRQQEFSINDGEHQIITFPQKGKQFLDTNTYWEQQDSKYVFQFMRQCINLNQGENIIKVYTPADYWSDTSMVATIEIDYMALTSIDAPDISTGIERESVSHWYLANSTAPTEGLSEGTLTENNGQKVISYKVTNTTNSESWHAIVVGSKNGTNILSTNSIESHPYLKFYYSCTKALATGSLDLCAYVYLKNGKVARVWGNRPVIKGDGTPSLFSVDLRQGWTGGDILNATTGYTIDDIDFSRPLIGLLLKPWYGQNRKISEKFDIRGLGFFKEDINNDTLLASPIVFNTNLYGDVMIEIPKMGYRVFRKDANKVQVSVTRDPEAPGFSYDAFTRTRTYIDPDTGEDERIVTLNDYLYVGAYLGSVNESQKLDENGNALYYNQMGGTDTTTEASSRNGYDYIAIITTDVSDTTRRLRSLSGKPWARDLPMVYSFDGLTARAAADNNNTDTVRGYSLLSYYAYNLIHCLSLLYNKTLSSYYSGDRTKFPSNPLTGNLNQKGMMYGVSVNENFNNKDLNVSEYNKDNPNNYQGKFIGIENIYNFLSNQFIDGAKIDISDLLIGNNLFIDESKWDNVGDIGYRTRDMGISKKTIMGGNTLGFLAKEPGGGNSTYWGGFEAVLKQHGYFFIGIGSNLGTISTYDPTIDTDGDGYFNNMPPTNEYTKFYGTASRLMYLKEE